MKKVHYNDIAGQKFTRLTVLERAESKGKHAAWKCVCDCGNEKIVMGANLRTGQVKSCGCLLRESSRVRSTKHGLFGTPEYQILQSIIQRCENENDKSYEQYGGRGITVCERWKNSLENFMTDMGNRPSSKHSIDRIEVHGNYEPDNCRWATKTEQSRNRGTWEKSKSGCKGVYWNNQKNVWQVSIGVNYKTIHLGFFDNLDAAIKSRGEAEIKYWS